MSWPIYEKYKHRSYYQCFKAPHLLHIRKPNGISNENNMVPNDNKRYMPVAALFANLIKENAMFHRNSVIKSGLC